MNSPNDPFRALRNQESERENQEIEISGRFKAMPQDVLSTLHVTLGVISRLNFDFKWRTTV